MRNLALGVLLVLGCAVGAEGWTSLLFRLCPSTPQPLRYLAEFSGSPCSSASIAPGPQLQRTWPKCALGPGAPQPLRLKALRLGTRASEGNEAPEDESEDWELGPGGPGGEAPANLEDTGLGRWGSDELRSYEDMNPRIVFENDDAVIVLKPDGIACQDEPKGRAPGLFTLIRHLQNFSPAAFSYDGPLYPVHRLDKATSGCLLLAKSKEAAAQISKAFASRHVAKYYIAVTDKKPSKKMGSVSGDMQRSRRSSWKLLRSQQNPAVTSFMQTSFALEGYGTLRLFALKPHTGKTHQLRVAMRCLSSPILGDSIYYPGGDSKKEERTYLHATAIRLTLNGKLVQAVIPPWEAGGEIFESESFKQTFESFFLPGVKDNNGIWFPETKLLRSDPSGL